MYLYHFLGLFYDTRLVRTKSNTAVKSSNMALEHVHNVHHIPRIDGYPISHV